MTTCFDQGLMTPLSATSYVGFRRDSDAQPAWTGHPNTPVQGLVEPIDIGQYDNLHIHVGGSAYTPSFQDDFSYPTCNIIDPGTSSQGSCAPSFGSYESENIKRMTSSPFTSPSQYGTSSMFSSFSGDMHSPCSEFGLPPPRFSTILPLQMLKDPTQDPSQYMPNDWSTASADIDYSQRFGHSPTSPVLHNPPLEVKPSASGSSVKTRSTLRRSRKETKRGGITYNGRTDNGTIENCVVSMDEKALQNKCGLIVEVHKYRCTFANCDKAFARSEHQKRHMRTHNEKREYKCLIGTCKAGKGETGAVNRNDNANDHAYTHLKAWLSSEGAEQRAQLWGQSDRRNRARNSPVRPSEMRRLILERTRFEPEKYSKCFNTLNRKAGADFGIHINFYNELCEMTRCQRRSGRTCQVCHDIDIKKNSRQYP